MSSKQTSDYSQLGASLLTNGSAVTVRHADGSVRTCSLPGLYALLMTDTVEDLPALRPHQRPALHCFLAQTAALALLAANLSAPPAEPDLWTQLLRALTPDFPDDEPWSLVVEDLSKPAFMQAPVPEGTWNALEKSENCPDCIDLFTKGRQHDLKVGRITDCADEHWIFALISIQTATQQHGPTNKGSSRSSDGNNFRPFMGLAPPGKWGSHLRRDILRLLEVRTELMELYPGYKSSQGKALLWLEPWDGTTSLVRPDLDLYYVEITRRLRLRRKDGHVVARRTGTVTPRVRQPDGISGDPWTAYRLTRDGQRPHTVYANGFDFRTVVDILNPEKYRPSILQMLSPVEPKDHYSLVLCGVGTARGKNGALDGYHERRIPLPTHSVALLQRPRPAPRLGDLAKIYVEDVAWVERYALSPALFTLFHGAPKDKDDRAPKAETKAKVHFAAFERAVDQAFFVHLFAELAEEAGSAAAAGQRRIWIDFLKECALDALATAEAGSPLSHVRRYRARAAAERVLVGALRGHFKDVFSEAA